MSERHPSQEDDAMHSTASEAVQALGEVLLKPNDNLCRDIQDALNFHSAALMAPVTETVEQNGLVEEMASPNPTRLLLFRTLQRKLQEDSQDSSCYRDCLVRALQVARALEGTKKHANGKVCDVPVAWMLQHGTNRLDVFWAFLQRHPETSRAFANVILFQKEINNHNTCECAPASHFLQRMHSETTVAASILTLAFQNWPLTLWLAKKGTFSFRLLQGIDSAVRVTYCCFQGDKHSRSILSLVQVLLRCIPWQATLQSPCEDLVKCLTDSLSENNEACVIFLELCGGQVTPEGDETPMSPFVKAWLETNTGMQWFTKLLQLHQQNQSRARMNATHPVLYAILTSNFIMISHNDDLWQLFQATICGLRGEKRGFELMEAILKGRHSASTLLRKLPAAWWEEMSVGLAADQSIAATVCSCCGYLRSEDWAQQDNFEAILESIISVCSDHRIGAKWRTVSLKGLGNACTDLFTVSNAIRSQQNRILQAAITTMDDPNAQVRCMSMFVVGNLSLALRVREAALQSISLWIIISDMCLAKLQEEDNEKVINNVIRSLGQIAALFLVQPDVDQLIPYVTQIMDALKARVHMSLPNNGDAELLSWKQRSARKRIRKNNLDCCGVLGTLAEVIKDGTNEKVVVSASKAIRSYSGSLRINLSSAIEACVKTLECGESTSRVYEELEMLLPVLLQNMTQSDAICWISNLQDNKDKVLHWLFVWMMSNSVPSDCFVVLSQAMNRSGIQVDISVEQMFATAIRDDREEDGDEL